MTFAQLSYAERVYDVEAGLSALLPILPAPAPTRVIAEKLARHLGAPVDEVARILLKLAPKHPNATHNGRVTMRFGRSMTGWLWHALPQAEGSVVVPPAPAEPLPCARCELEPRNPSNAGGLCDACIREAVARDMQA